jgi:hypothetical protein
LKEWREWRYLGALLQKEGKFIDNDFEDRLVNETTNIFKRLQQGF